MRVGGITEILRPRNSLILGKEGLQMVISRLTDNIEAQRFELDVDGDTAFVDYEHFGDTYHLNHSEVPAKMRGLGVGQILVDRTFEHLAAQNKKIVANCGFIRRVAQRDKRWQGMVDMGSHGT